MPGLGGCQIGQKGSIEVSNTGWIGQLIAITVFVTSCVGLGFLAELWVLRNRWPEWFSGIMSAAVALLWPALLLGYFILDGAPPLLIMSMATAGTAILSLLGAPLARAGASIARRRNSQAALR